MARTAKMESQTMKAATKRISRIHSSETTMATTRPIRIIHHELLKSWNMRSTTSKREEKNQKPSFSSWLFNLGGFWWHPVSYCCRDCYEQARSSEHYRSEAETWETLPAVRVEKSWNWANRMAWNLVCVSVTGFESVLMGMKGFFLEFIRFSLDRRRGAKQ